MSSSENIRLAADVILLGDWGGVLHVLLIERRWPPFEGCWALPGGHVDAGESTEDAAHRELIEETGIGVGCLRYVGTYSNPGRDPRGRYVAVAYLGRLGHQVEPTAGDDAARAEWVPVDEVLSARRPVAFDHLRIIRDALAADTFGGQAVNP